MDSEEVILEDDFEEGSEEDGDPEYEFINDPPSTQASSGPASTPTSCTSSPPILGDDPASPNRGIFLSTSGQTMHIHQYSGNILTSGSGSGGKPPAIRRGPGRPRKEYSPSIRVTKDTRLIKRYRGSGGVRGVSKRKYFQSGSAVDILAQLGIHQASDGSVNFMNSSGLLQQPTAIATTTSTPTATTTSSLPSTPTQEEASTPSTAATTPTSNPPTLDPDAGIVLSGDKLMQPPEEPPYFPEKWPGKFCALCNLGERSQLGQGEMLRLELGADEVEKVPLSTTPTSDDKDSALASVDDKSPRGGPLPQLSNRRQKGLNKCKNPVMTSEYIDELEKIGHIDQLEFANLFDGAYFYVHRSCAIWSSGVTRDSSGTLSNVGTVIAQSLSRKCSFCLRHGASVICKMSCPKVFHFPCVAASGGFQIVQTYISFCKEHLGQVPLVCTEDINCRSCSGLGDVSNLMMCSMCGDHYHGTCIGVAQLPGVRAGWQCHSCRHCQICRLPDATEGRSLACEQCDKIYHAQCLRPVMTSIPKYGWKCRCCRVCSDCGSRTPGAGTSSRWHSHYTVCDSCYQQRNKGFSCPICHRAYRAAAYREMVKCNLCNKFVHNTCDSDAELSSYHTKKESNPDYEYVCPPCKQLAQNGRMVAAMRRASSIDEDSMSASQESLYTDDVEMSETGGNSCGATGGEKLNADYGLGKGKPYAATKIAKKRLGLSGFTQMGRPKGGGKFGLQKRLRYNELSRKRGPKSKMRGIFGVPGLGLQRPTSDVANKTDEEPGIENRLVLCSAKDKFVLTQDICVMCGAIGTDQEGCLIACTQCGQCYHPYCVNVKVTKVILQKGWRCLDCTVCEGCGQRNDEARLILCDECDISYHIYCMDPPLDIVPHGNWKCRWCAICQKCGTNDPGFNCSWMNSYSECGPCASQSNCPSCSDAYAEGELIIQCTQCERWLHCSCDAIRTDEEAEKCSEEGYTCVLCRPRDIPPPHLQPKLQTQTSFNRSMSGSLTTKSPDDSDIGPILALDGNHYVDGVCLSEHGLTQIKSLQLDSARKRRPKHKVNADPTIADKEAGILAAIESVVAGSSHDNSLEDVKVEPLDPKEEAEIYKDGMVWDRADASPPEGFTLYTTEQGTVVLRKKRQRNLQKLGIGGFNVRNRTLKSLNNKETFEGEDITDGMVPQWTNANSTSETSDKKKKAIRRKQKNKLIETYPSYLQEAFFGKSLLDTSKAKFESSSSDDEAKSTVSDDKTIKLSMEELKMIEAMRAKQQQQHQQMIDDQKTRQINALNSAQQSQHDSAQAGASLTLNASPLTKHSQIVPSAGNVPDQVQQTVASVKMEIMQTTSSSSMGGSANTGDGLKDILPRDLLDSDLVNTIMNEERDLNKNTDNLDEITENVGEMLPSPFNLDYVEEIFKGVLTDESQESQESLLTTSGPSTYSSTITQHSSMSQQPQIHAGNMSQTQQTMQMGMNMMGGQVDTTSSQQMQQTIHLQQSQSLGQAQQPQSTMTMTLLNQQGSGPQQGQPMQQNIIVRSATNQQHMGNQFGPVYTEKNMSQQSQWGQPIQQSGIPSIDSALGMSVADDSLSIAATPATNNQKTSDRMRQDEILGDMATISAVLYANMNHPELKTEYPNWTDRFKQILKKWRALSTENKQPFLQKARDNRSALRMKKAQQVPSMSPKDSQVHQTSGTAASAAMLSAIASDGSSEASGGELIVQQPQQQMQSRLGVGQAQAHQQSPQQQPPQQQQHMHHHQQILEDQEKINAQQKTMREQEQERQWKQLQANRAREQQMQQLVIHNQGGQESSLQLQVSTHNDGNSIGPMASPSPTSRPITNFVTPSAKGRPSVLPTNVNTSGYPHSTMTRPVSVQIPRGQQQQTRMTQSPFSPQSQASQSPHDQFPSSPVPQGMDTFSRPPSEGSQQDQFILSPQANRSFGHQSPNPAPNRSPAYVGQQPSVQIPAKQIRLNIDNTGYAHAPGTPRPTASTGIMRSTVYATRPLFSGNQTSPFTSPRPSDTFQSQQTPTQPQQYQQQPQPEGNRQLRDLLQRQQMVTPNSTGMVSPQQQQQHVQSPQSQNPPPSPRWNMENVDEQPATTSQQQHQQAPDNITFRQPLPPGLTSRPQRMQLATGPVLVRPGQQQMQPQVSINNQIINTRLAQIPPELRQRMIRPQIVTSVIASNQQSQMIMTQQSNIIQPGNIMQQSQAQQHQQQFGVRKIDQYGQLIGNQGGSNQNQMQQQQQMQQSQQDQQNVALLAQKLDRIQPGNINSGGNLIDVRQATSDSSHMTGTGDSETPEIPDNVTAELEKLEQEESGGMGEVEGVGDILGGLGDDDEELLVSLTAEMGADFNILEYADPELDTLNDGEKANLLDSLELDEDSEKDDKPGKKELPEKDDGSGGQIRSTTTDITSTTNNMTQCETMHTISGNQNITLSNTMHTMQVMHQTTTQAGGHNTNMSGGTLIQQSQVSQNPQIQQQNIVLDNSQQLHQQQQQRIHQLKILQQQQQHQQHTQVHQIIPANLQQIQQQMLQKVQQAAAMGKPMQVGTQLMSNGAIGIVTANNNVQVSFPGLMNRNGQQLVTQHRLQPLRMPTAGQDHQVQQQPNQGPRMILQQQLQQQSPQINRIAIGNTQGQTQGQINQPPPPPYPGPPPPYPGSSQVPAQQTSNQEQPLLLEDLLEQEKREQERQQITSTIANVQSNSQINPGIIDDQNYQRVTGDIFSGNTQTTSGQGLLSMQQTSQQQQLVGGTSGIKPQFLPRGLNHAQWRPTNPQQQQQQQQMPSPGTPTQVVDPSGIRRDGNGAIQLFTANLQPPPPLPPETIASEQDRQIQVTYEQWLTQQHNVLAEQLKYYETEVTKLRKVKKSLNSKQRQMRKLGSELSENDARDLAKVTSEQNIVQKQLESARKQSRQHSLVIQDYKGKQMSKMQNQMISPIGTLPGSSPAHMAPQSPITSPSPGAQQILQTTGQSPLNNQMVQSHQSPLHSPSPLMSSQSPGPTSVNSIMQSPGNQQSSMSPYNTMQPSPRIGTPLSQVDECPFSPNNPGPSPTPSIPGRLTSPQHRMGAPNMPGNRIVTSPGVSYQQQQNIMGQNQILPTAAQQQQQNRFVRPQIMAMQSDGTIRPRIVFNQQQQQQQQQQLMRQTSAGYNSPLGSPQPTINQGGGQGQGQHQMDHMHNQRTMQLVQQRHLIQRQQMLQQQQQQQQQYVKQGNTQQQQPQSPMLNQVINPPSPMARGGINQYSNTNQPMQSPVMRRPPSTGGITANSPVGSERPQSVENSPRHMYLQQHSDSGGGGNMDSSTGNAGGGGGNTHNMNNPIPLPPSFGRFGYIKLGLRGGSPMWSYGSKRMPAPAAAQNMSGDNKPMASTSSGGSGQSVRKDTHLNRISILKKKKVPGLPHDMVIKSSKAVNLSSMEYGDLEDSSNTPPESPLHVRGETKGKMTLLSQSQSTARGAGESRKGQDDIVVIDSSPDEKQRIMDYDDDNDKAVVATEVSLSSAAQSVPDTDDISVIESLAPTEFDAIVSSPLESEVTEEYVLFAPDMVVDYADSDDSMKNTSMSHLPKTTISDEDKTLELIASPGVEFVRSDDTDDDTEKDKGGQFSEEHFTTGEEDMMSMGSEIVIIGSDIKSPEEQLVSTTDVLDVILSQSSTSKDTKQTSSEPSSPHVESTSGEQFGKSVIGLATTSGAVSKKGSSILTYSSRLPVTSTLITTRPSNQMSPSTMTAVSVHKKLMKDVTQTTAIVSIGNTTISVPVLKNVPLPHNKATVCDAQSSGHKTTKGRLVAKSPISVKLPKSVITMSGHKVLSPASIVTISSLNLGQSTGHNKATVAQITHKSPSPVTVTSQSVSEKMLERLATKSSSSSLVYSKLSSLTVNQDASLPHKIFEDESVSPDSSIEHDDPDLASPEHKIDFLSDSDRVYVATESMSEDMKEVNRDKSIEDTSGDTKEATVSETNVATNKNTIEIAKEDGDESKEVKEVKNSELPKVSVEMKQKQNVIPFHVIVKSRESPRSPKLSTTNQRNISSMPQLSPLSQPTEMATNMQNVSQEVRSILSSISSSSPSVTTLSLKVDSSTNAEKTVSTEASSDAPPTVKMSSDVSNVNYESLLPLTKVEMSKTESIAPIIVKATTATATPTTYADITKVAVSDRNSPVVTNPTSGGSILVVKQLLTGNQITTSPKGQLTTKSTGNSPVSQTPGGTQSVIIAQGQQVIPNLTKIQAESQQQKDRAKSPGVVSILSNQLTGQHTRIINYSDLQYSSTQPPALVMTSRQGVISGTVVPITTSAVVSGPPTSTAIHFSGSILGATLSQPSLKSTTQSPMGGSTLLHTQLTSAPFRRSKSTEEQPAATPALIHGTKRHSVELTNVVKSEPMDTTEESTTPTSTMITPPKVSDSLSGGCKFSTMSVPPVKSEDSQNVLLKQLLQNSGSTSTPSPTPPAIASRTVPGLRAPSLGLVSSLEAQLARPALPPVPSNASQIMPPSQASTSPTPATTQTTPLCTEVNVTKSTMRTHIFMQRETSFVSKPPKSPNQQQTQQQQLSQAQTIPTSTQSFVTTVDMSAASAELKGISVKHEELDAKTTLRTFPTEPPPPYPTLSSSLDAIAPPNVVINKDMPLPVQVTTVAASFVKQSTTPPVTTNVGPPGLAVIDVKKENIIDVAAIVGVGEKNQQKAADSGTFMVPKTEFPDPMEAPPSDTTAVKTAQETALEIKKRKRREYQKSRRQMQILSKEAMSSSTKKRPRKFSKVEEDYDTFIDNLMGQLRQLPHMQILEPTLCRNFGVGSVYGTGDLSKISSVNDYSITVGDLQGEYGVAEVPNVADFYNTKPFGIKSTINDMGSSTSTHYGFYDQEFAPMSFDVEDDNRYKYETLMKERDNETPDTVISSSSPECTMWEPLYLYPGLKVINEECDNDEEVVFRSMSPQIPLVAPIPIRLKPGMSAFSRSLDMCNKENEGTKDIFGVKSRFGSPTPLKDNSNVTVTLTLTSSAAEDIMGVLRNLANILHIPAPTAYQIVERTTTPPSQKLGLYRTKGKDGKEGAPIDIQTILNGAAKFCRHCDVVILNSMIRAKASEFPLLTLNNTNELINDTDDLYFCSRSCYKQFQWRPTSILEENRQDTTTKSTNEHEKNLKVDEKTFSDVIMTTSTTCDLNDEDLKMEVDLDETDIKEATSGIDLKELDIKQELRDEGSVDDDDERQSKYKGVRYKMFSNACFAANMIKYKKPTEKEITETLFRMNITVTANKMPEDTRKCIFCHQIGDGVADGPSRLLNFDVDKWVHLNCALWSDGVYETVNGALMNLENALQASLVQTCVMCGNLGATIKCFKTRCTNVYHLNCALKDNCVFYKNKTTMCSSHAPKTEKDNELTTLSVQRRVYVERDESRQVASVMHHSELSNLMRVGSLIFLNVGQLLPHQLIAFHTPNYIYPIGYKIIRFYWSMRQPNRRCRYICSIADVSGRPEFRVLVQESQRDDIELRDSSPRAVWQRILEPLAQMRKENQLIQVFPKYITGEDLFGLTEPAVVRILESLPGIETLTDYRFKYGRNPLLELPLAINPSGAARTEPKLKQSVGWKKPHTQRTGSTSQRPTFVPTASIAGEVACPYSKQFVHSKSSQYKKMKQEWRNNVYLARSKIQGLGLYAARDLEKHTMVIEYIGEVIRTELSESREKQYEAKNRGIYMFRLDEDRVVDATLCGGLARYINHSCNPNCVTEIVEVDRDYRIIIFAKRRINRGEELSYDYKFDIEDDAHKISCMCGAPNCRKWMN